MSVPDEYSTWCDFDCGSYNVRGYCIYHLVEFFNWIKRNKIQLTQDNFDELKDKFAKSQKQEEEAREDE